MFNSSKIMANNVTREEHLEALVNAIKNYADSKLAAIGGDSAAIISDFTGATSTTGEQSGLVPAAGDNDKFLRGDGQWVTLSGGGQSYSIATSTQAGLMSAEDKQHLDAVFQDSADLTDAVITVVGGKFIPSVDSVSDFNTYKDSNLPFLSNRLKKVINNTDNPYGCPKES